MIVMDDESVTAAAESDATEVVAETALAPELAWSDDTEVDEPERAPWGVAWRRAAVVLAVCLMAAALVVLGWRDWSAQHRSATAPVSVSPAGPMTSPAASPAPAAAVPAPPSQTTPAPEAPTSVAQTMAPPPAAASAADRDAAFLALVSGADVHSPTDAQAIHNGHLVCKQLDQGLSRQYIAGRIQAVSPAVTADQIQSVIGAAITAYCPQYAN